ncbi:hypothetical protein F993_01477 [Acinetobacter proteolyticus]|uniref:Restriction endonuclease type IV Mrr domain-containing protein n=1 Tax=Acinetobacter proteolyticus TaxID=1776741 RepID=A0ABP2TP73_9GAMM|nr:hypothetical protein [Acinetobacter proteolyticus]ENU24161.1 hypothetical protein F993_01477 [Acinetobacter proteolyticus]
MSNLVHFEYAPPKSWEQFEELCADLFMEIWNDPNAVRYGRGGQKQYGVDILISNGSITPIGLQCKKKSRWPVKKLTFQEVLDEVDKADRFTPILKEYYILTTAESDAVLLAEVLKLNDERTKSGKFKVTVFSWAEIVSRLSICNKTIKKHYNIGSDENYFSPLISTWYIKNDKIELNGDNWTQEVKKCCLDFYDYPNGHLVIRQRETDVLLKKLKLSVNPKNLKEANALICLREKIKRNTLKEKEASLCVERIIKSKTIMNSIVSSYSDTPDNYYFDKVLTSVIEKFFSINNESYFPKISLIPPEINTWANSEDQAFRSLIMKNKFDKNTLTLPPNLLVEIFNTEREFSLKYAGNQMAKVVDELPRDLKAKYIIPRILYIIFSIMELSGKDINDLERIGFLNLNCWKYDY